MNVKPTNRLHYSQLLAIIPYLLLYGLTHCEYCHHDIQLNRDRQICATCVKRNEQLLKQVRRVNATDNLYSSLPKASIVITSFNEWIERLLATLDGIYLYTPHSLFVEVIIVDDHSESPVSQDLTKRYPKLSIVRNKKREGLIRARLIGATKAIGDVLVFLDSHVQATPYWMEPLLVRLWTSLYIGEERGLSEECRRTVLPERIVVSPVIYDLNTNESVGEIAPVGGFHWNFTFKWEYWPENQMSRLEPITSPVLAGPAFAVWRSAFFQLGSFDPEMEIWGGENIELALRLWMSQGRVEIIPCSVVGHWFQSQHPYEFPLGKSETVLRNLKRVALVWLLHSTSREEAKPVDTTFLSYFLSALPEALAVPTGSLEARKTIANRFGRHSFTWYTRCIYPRLLDQDNLPRLINNIDFLSKLSSGSSLGIPTR